MKLSYITGFSYDMILLLFDFSRMMCVASLFII